MRSLNSEHIWNEVAPPCQCGRTTIHPEDSPVRMVVPGQHQAYKMFLKKQPRPLGSQPVSQQPRLPLATHHETVCVCKVDDIWSFGLNQTAFGNYLSWHGADSGYFSNLHLGTCTEKTLNCILQKPQLKIPLSQWFDVYPHRERLIVDHKAMATSCT